MIRRPHSSAPPVLFSKRFPPKSPHPRLFIAARARSPMVSRLPPARLPSRLQAPCSTPIGFLDPISLTPPCPPPEHLPTCSSPEADSSSVLSPPLPLPSPLICGVGRSVHLRCRWIRWRCHVLDFLFRALSFCYDISDLPTIFRPCIILCQSIPC
jgi:hypothetical protein